MKSVYFIFGVVQLTLCGRFLEHLDLWEAFFCLGLGITFLISFAKEK